MSQDEKFEFESVQDCRTIQKYLQALLEGFDQGRLVLSAEGSEIVLHPTGYMKFEVTVKKKGQENKLAIKVGWKDRDDQAAESGTISISS
ncbi:amphi-Trp domain-containing protein [Desulfomicrobium salsuginis]